MYNTMLGVDVPVNLLARLDEMARAQRVTRSELVRGALAKFAGVEIAPYEHQRSDRDGQETKALAIIRESPESSVRELRERLEAAGIKRGHNWVWEKRRATLSSD